jgi:hypothetical protein
MHTNSDVLIRKKQHQFLLELPSKKIAIKISTVMWTHYMLVSVATWYDGNIWTYVDF